jgi:hypothetical protein
VAHQAVGTRETTVALVNTTYRIAAMKSIINSALGALLACSAFAGPPFQISTISSSKVRLNQNVMINGRVAKQETHDALDVTVFVTEDTASSDLIVKGYFFSGDYKNLQVATPAPIPRINERVKGGEYTMPPVLQAGRKYNFQFMILPNDNHVNWKRLVMLFGTKDNLTAKIYPKDDLSKFDFPEKSVVKN